SIPKNHNIPWLKASELGHRPSGQRVRIAGLLSLVQRPPTAKGFAFLSLEDEAGMFNVVLIPAIYEQFRLTIARHSLLEIIGRLEKAEGVINIRAERILPLKFETEPEEKTSLSTSQGSARIGERTSHS